MYRYLSPIVITLSLLILFSVSRIDAQKKTSGRSKTKNTATLEQRLQAEDAIELTGESRKYGSATRGAILFYQPVISCTKCHSVGEELNTLGPNLADWKEPPKAGHIVEALLHPSRKIREGYEAVTVVTEDGKTFTGLVHKDEANELVLRDSSRDGKTVVIPKKDIELRKKSGSIMPQGLVNQLANRQQFLDLVKYLLEVSEQGAKRAIALKPPASLFALPPVDEYEKRIDHAALISSRNKKSFERGKAIYERLCINCHGTRNRTGSLPTSLKFGSGTFKNGSDPYSMYQTLTHGFGMMVPQSWMVPEQKYDVIHYICEAYLKPYNRSQLKGIDGAYLARLPKGNTRGPKPLPYSPWENMNYGPHLIHSFEAGQDGSNIAYKGIAMRLDHGPGGVSRGKHWMIFDHDTMRVSAAWSGNRFIDYRGIMFDGRHNIHPRLMGQIAFANPTAPGWANPETGSFDDPRLRGRDGKPYGPLPREWAHYKGLYHYGNHVVISYTVGKTDVLEMPGVSTVGSQTVFTRTFNIGPRDKEMILQVAKNEKGSHFVKIKGARWTKTDKGDLRLVIPPGKEPLRFTLSLTSVGDSKEVTELASAIVKEENTIDLSELTKGGPARWPERIMTQTVVRKNGGPFEVDVLTRPVANPWSCRVRFTGLDFAPDGKEMAICTWDGDVWLVEGWVRSPDDDPANFVPQTLTWQRIASGLFQPLGLKYVDGKIYVACRDQIAILHDLNGDGEIDFYENFNNDHQVTEHFHEFAMGLQRDNEGNFYYAKSARHALPALVPHHGTLLKVSRDGSKTEILANGFRAANGVCVNPDGTFFVTDQEGHWTPKNRINWVKKGGFYGNMMGYHNVTDTSDSAMEQPLCWITNAFDRSPAELMWVKDAKWGPLNGLLLNLSYGYGKVFVVLHEKIGDGIQGGMCELPLPQFPTGLIRGRFHKRDGQLYSCGMFAWAGNQQQPGGLYRIRYTGRPMNLPVKLRASKGKLSLTFTETMERESVSNPKNFIVRVWDLKRTKNYGSKHLNERYWKVEKATLSQDGKTVMLSIPQLAPTWSMEIKYKIRSRSGEEVRGKIHNTIHEIGK